ncbi:MAG: sigma-70 factor domain-containing protein, partial [Waterburya sp.]
MLASSSYVETEGDNSFAPDINLDLEAHDDSSNKLPDELVELDLEGVDLESISRRGSRTTTDLVRLYLQEIGRVPLLERDEEVSEAQKVQRHIQIL